MHPKQLELTATEMHPDDQARRIATEPADGHVWDPWSGLYLETDAAYRNRMASAEYV
jgi:hypothetical protein